MGSLAARPRVLNGAREVSTAAELWGGRRGCRSWSPPSPTGGWRAPSRVGDGRRRRRGRHRDVPLDALDHRPAEVAAAAPQGRHWFQLYAFKDAGVTRALMDEAIDAGFEAILVTADAPPGGNRERDRRNRFTLPRELGTPSLTAATGGERALTIEETFALMNHALTWADLADLASDAASPSSSRAC